MPQRKRPKRAVAAEGRLPGAKKARVGNRPTASQERGDVAPELPPGLPDFPNLKSELDNLAVLFVRARSRGADPVVARIGTTIQHEGHARYIQNDGGEKRYFKYERVEAPISIPTDEFRHLPFEGLLAKLATMADELGGQQARSFFEKIGRASERAGTAIDAGGQPLTLDLLLELLRRTRVDFDPATNKPVGLTFAVTPELAAQLPSKLEEWQRDPASRARIDAAMEEKRDEWRTREARRTLVD